MTNRVSSNTANRGHEVRSYLFKNEQTEMLKSPGTNSELSFSYPKPAFSMADFGKPISLAEREYYEPRFGHDFSKVRIHTDNAAAQSAHRINARAYTAGNHIVFNSGQYSPKTTDGRKLLGHELTHVVQYNRSGSDMINNSVASCCGAVEREAAVNGFMSSLGLPLNGVSSINSSIALTPTSEYVDHQLSYALNDWAVTTEEETEILDVLERDGNLTTTINDLKSSGMLTALFDRIDDPKNRRRLLQILGKGLNASGRTLVEPHIRQLGPGAELQFKLGQFGVTAAATPFNPAPLEAAVVGTARTAKTGFNAGGFLSGAFTGVGATGVIPTTSYKGTFYSTSGLPGIPIEDEARLALKDSATEAKYSNPLGSLTGYLGTLTATQRKQQAELLLRRRIATVEEQSYAGNLPSRLQVIKGAAAAHNLNGAMVTAIILAEQRDQTQAEDAKDYQAATSIMRGNTSIGLGQVVVSTAQKNDLFSDLASAPTRAAHALNKSAGHNTTATLLASDEYNIFATARYIRQVANEGATKSLASLPLTAAAFPGLVLPAYLGNSSTWPDDNIKALGMYYTSKAWTDDLRSAAWGDFVFEAYQDVKATGLL